MKYLALTLLLTACGSSPSASLFGAEQDPPLVEAEVPDAGQAGHAGFTSSSDSGTGGAVGAGGQTIIIIVVQAGSGGAPAAGGVSGSGGLVAAAGGVKSTGGAGGQGSGGSLETVDAGLNKPRFMRCDNAFGANANSIGWTAGCMLSYSVPADAMQSAVQDKCAADSLCVVCLGGGFTGIPFGEATGACPP